MKKSEIIAYIERLTFRCHIIMKNYEDIRPLKPMEVYSKYQQVRGIMTMWNETHKTRITEFDMTRKRSDQLDDIRDYLKQEGYIQ